MVHMLSIVQITLAILLTVLVLVQRATTDASGALGADGGSGAVLEKRGAEKTLYRLTLMVAIAFVASVAYPLIVR
jgi:protein translocase SecG subunit